MSIESTEFITREQAIDRIEYYMSLKYKNLSNNELDKLLHSLKYELNEDIFENYIIEENDEEIKHHVYIPIDEDIWNEVHNKNKD